MDRTTARRFALPILLAVALLAAPQAATAAAPKATPPDLDVTLPAGEGCADFDLRVIGIGSKAHIKEFTDSIGKVVRMITAGKGFTLTYENVDTGETLNIKASGSVQHSKFNPDGTTTVTSTGHNGLILFPTDVPAGPSATQYVGRIVYTVDRSGVFTLVSTSGTSTDICAALAP